MVPQLGYYPMKSQQQAIFSANRCYIFLIIQSQSCRIVFSQIYAHSMYTECPVFGMNFSRSVSNYCSTPHTKLLELVSTKSECFSSLSTSISYILILISISISILHISRSISNQIAASAFHSLILHPGVHNTHSFSNTIGWCYMKDNIAVLRHCNITTWNTILQYNNIAELENCNFRTLQPYNFTTLQHYKITTLPHYHITTLHYNITEGCLL